MPAVAYGMREWSDTRKRTRDPSVPPDLFFCGSGGSGASGGSGSSGRRCGREHGHAHGETGGNTVAQCATLRSVMYVLNSQRTLPGLGSGTSESSGSKKTSDSRLRQDGAPKI